MEVAGTSWDQLEPGVRGDVTDVEGWNQIILPGCFRTWRFVCRAPTLQDGNDVLPSQSLCKPEFVMSLRIELVPLRTADEEMPDH